MRGVEWPSLRGMILFFKQVSVTREEYLEWGGERIKKWWGGNWNSASELDVDPEDFKPARPKTMAEGEASVRAFLAALDH